MPTGLKCPCNFAAKTETAESPAATYSIQTSPVPTQSLPLYLALAPCAGVSPISEGVPVVDVATGPWSSQTPPLEINLWPPSIFSCPFSKIHRPWIFSYQYSPRFSRVGVTVPPPAPGLVTIHFPSEK